MMKRSNDGSWVRAARITSVMVLGLVLPTAVVAAWWSLPAPTGAVSTPVSADAPTSTDLLASLVADCQAATPYVPRTFGASCTANCRAQYDSCLDDCQAAPFPGCEDHCRFDVLYPCYESCFGA